MHLFKRPNQEQDCEENNYDSLWIGLGMAILYAIAASLFFLPKRYRRPVGKKIDIEIRYDTEKTADTTFMAQNLVKIIRIVLTPLQSKINEEGASLIFVYGDESWEMRVRNGSEKLRQSVRNLLEANEW